MDNSILTKEAVESLIRKFIRLEAKFESGCFSGADYAAFEEVKHDLIGYLSEVKKEPVKTQEQHSSMVYLEKLLSSYIGEE